MCSHLRSQRLCVGERKSAGSPGRPDGRRRNRGSVGNSHVLRWRLLLALLALLAFLACGGPCNQTPTTSTTLALRSLPSLPSSFALAPTLQLLPSHSPPTTLARHRRHPSLGTHPCPCPSSHPSPPAPPPPPPPPGPLAAAPAAPHSTSQPPAPPPPPSAPPTCTTRRTSVSAPNKCLSAGDRGQLHAPRNAIAAPSCAHTPARARTPRRCKESSSIGANGAAASAPCHRRSGWPGRTVPRPTAAGQARASWPPPRALSASLRPASPTARPQPMPQIAPKQLQLRAARPRRRRGEMQLRGRGEAVRMLIGTGWELQLQ